MDQPTEHTVETDAGVGCPHRESHDPRVCAVHVAIAESAGIYDLDDDEAAHFLQVFDSRVDSPGATA